tara:strand:+ start:57948 stop:58526 length:579 start_codon:yes stop_codon:yes gene_type:complete
MKNLISSVLVLVLCISCNPEAKKAANDVLKAVQQTEEKSTHQLSDFENISAELLKKTSLTDEELLEAFPKELMGFSVDRVNAIPYMQQVVGLFGNRKIVLSIADAAGKNNSLVTTFLGFYSYVPLGTDQNKLIKVERNGIKTISETMYNETEMKFIYDDRFYISVEAKAMNPDELWEALDLTVFTRYQEMNK